MEPDPSWYEAPGAARNDNAIDDRRSDLDLRLPPDETSPEEELRRIFGALSGPQARADLADAKARAEADRARNGRSAAVSVAVLAPLLAAALLALAGS